MEDSPRYCIADDVVFRNISGETVLLNLNTGTYFGLDEVGTRVWQLLEDKKPVDAVVRTLLAEYRVEEARLRDDLDRLFGQLVEKGLVKVGV